MADPSLEGRLRVRLSGPVRIEFDDSEIRLRGLRETALLARLALDAGTEVSRGRLIEDVWNGVLPDSGSGALRAQVLRLRRLLETVDLSSVLETTTNGYALAIPRGCVDLFAAVDFANAALSALGEDPHQAVELFEKARELWTGRPLVGLEDLLFAQSQAFEITRGVEMATRHYTRALIAAGRAEEAARLLAPMVADDLLDAELVVVFMEAVRLAGRPHEALRLAQEHRRVVRDVGLVPAERFLLEEQHALGADGSAQSKVELVGRSVECGIVERALVDLSRGRGGLITVSGEPGVGKSALLDWVSATAQNSGYSVMRSAGDRFERDVPLHAVRELFDTFPKTRETLRLILGGLAKDIPRDSLTSTQANLWLRYETTNQIAAAFVADLKGPAVIVVDDLHWADGSSIGALRALRRVTTRVPMLVVASGRPTGSDGWRSQISGPTSSDIVLAPLGREMARALAEMRAGGAVEPNLAEAVDSADGIPLLIVELIEAFRLEGRLVDQDGRIELEGSEIPGSFRQMVGNRIADMPPPVRNLCEHAAILGRKCRLELLALFMSEQPLAVARSVSDAARYGVLESTGPWVSFRHDLVRDAVEFGMDQALQAHLHRRAAEVLASQGAGITTIAAHAALAASTDGDVQLADWLRRAADTAAALEPRTALRYLDRALDLTRGDRQARHDVQRARAEVLLAAGDLAVAAELLGVLVGMDKERSHATRLRLAGVRLLQNDPELGLSEIEEAVKAGPDQRTLARLRAVSSLISLTMVDLPSAEEAARAAENLGEETSDLVARSVANGVLSRTYSFGHHAREGMVFAKRAVEFAEADDTGEAHQYQPWSMYVMTAIDLDELDSATLAVKRGEAVARKRHTPWALPLYQALHASINYRYGRLDRARRLCESLLKHRSEVGVGQVDGWALAFLALIQFRSGEHDAGVVSAARSYEAISETGNALGLDYVVLARAESMVRTGDAEAALGELRGAWDLFQSVGANSCLPQLAAPLARLAAILGRPEAANGVVEECRLAADRTRVVGYRALERRVEGLLAGDADLLHTSCTLYASTERELDLADCRSDFESVDAGRALPPAAEHVTDGTNRHAR